MNCIAYDNIKGKLLSYQIKIDGKTMYPGLQERSGEVVLTKSNENDIKLIIKRFTEHAQVKYGLPKNIELFRLYDARKPQNQGYRALSIRKKEFSILQEYIDRFEDSQRKLKSKKIDKTFERNLEYFNHDAALLEQERKEFEDLNDQIDETLSDENRSYSRVAKFFGGKEVKEEDVIVKMSSNPLVETSKYNDQLLGVVTKQLEDVKVALSKEKNPTKIVELTEQKEELINTLYGNEDKGITGLFYDSKQIKDKRKEYEELQEKIIFLKGKIEEKSALGLSTTALENRLDSITQELYDLNYSEDTADLLFNQAIKNLARARKLLAKGDLDSLVKARQIIGFYKLIATTNHDNNPLFSREDLKSTKLSRSILDTLDTIAYDATMIDNDIKAKSKQSILNYINNLDSNFFRKVKDNPSEDFTEAEVFQELEDILTMDNWVYNISDNPFSKRQSILLEAIRKLAMDSVHAEQGEAREISDILNDTVDSVSKKLFEMGYTLAKKTESIVHKGLYNLLESADFSFFLQKDSKGNLKDNLIQRESEDYIQGMAEARNILNLNLAQIASGNSRKNREKVYFNYFNEIRKRSHIIKPHLLPELVNEYPDLITEDTKVENLDDSYVNELKELLGSERHYNEIIEQQKNHIETYKLIKQSKIDKMRQEYAINNDLELEDVTIEDIDDEEALEDFARWSINNNPFLNGKLFETNEKISIGENRYNSYDLNYSVFVPRRNQANIKINSSKRVPYNFKKLEITEDSSKPTNFYTEDFKIIDSDDNFYEYWKAASRASNFVKDALPTDQKVDYREGKLLFDESILLQEFTDKADSKKDKILSLISKPFKEALRKLAETLTKTQDTVYAKGIDYVNTNTEINKSSINRGGREIDNYLYLKKVGIYNKIKEAGINTKIKNLNENSQIRLDYIPTEIIKEALVLGGKPKNNIINLSRRELEREYINLYDAKLVNYKYVDQDGNEQEENYYRSNILGILKDLQMQHTLKDTASQNLNKMLLQSLELSSVIKGREKNLNLLETMKSAYEDIPRTETNTSGFKLLNRDNKAENKEATNTNRRKNAVAQVDAFFQNFIYLTPKFGKVLIEDLDSRPNSNFISDIMLDEKNSIKLLDNLIDNPNLDDDIKYKLAQIRKEKVKFLDVKKILIDIPSNVIRYLYLGYKTLTHLGNSNEAYLANVQLAVKKHYFDEDQLFKAYGIMKGAAIRTVTKYGPKKFEDITPEASTASVIINKLPFLEDASALVAKAERKDRMRGGWAMIKQDFSPYGLIALTEYKNQGVIALASLMNTEIEDINGNKSNVWEAYEKSGNNKGKLKPEYRTKDNIDTWENFKTQKALDFIDKIKYARNQGSGDYSFEGESKLNKTWIGQSMLNYKKWLPAYISQRYGTERMNMHSGEIEKGSYNSMHPIETLLFRSASSLTSAKLYKLPFILLYSIFDAYNYYRLDRDSRPVLNITDMGLKTALIGRTMVKEMLALPLNTITSGVTPFKSSTISIDKSQIGVGRILENKLKDRGIQQVDINNIKTLGVQLGFNMLFLGAMATCASLLVQLKLSDDDEEDKEKWKKYLIMSYNLSKKFNQQGTQYISDPLEAAKDLSSIATYEFLVKSQKDLGVLESILIGASQDFNATGETAGTFKSDNIWDKYSPINFGRDLKSNSKRIFEKNQIIESYFGDKAAKEKREMNNIKSRYKQNIVNKLSTDNLEEMFDKYNMPYKPETKDGEEESFETMKKRFESNLAKRLGKASKFENDLPEDIKKSSEEYKRAEYKFQQTDTYKQSVEDFKKVMKDEMTLEEWDQLYKSDRDLEILEKKEDKY